MSVNHCGRDWDTPYCGLCGKKLPENEGIDGLKAYVHRHVVRYTRMVETLPEVSPTKQKKKVLLAKWSSWQNALNEMMENDS